MLPLLFVLIVLVFVYVWMGRVHQPEEAIVPETFESLSSIIRARSSTNAELSRAVSLLIKNFVRIEAHNTGAYMQLIEMLCIHPHTDSKMLLRFEKALREANPSHAAEIKHALNTGLAARG